MKKIFLFIFVAAALAALTSNSNIYAKDKPVRGVWITNVDSHVLWSKKEIEEAVNLCDSMGINTIFMVTLNKGNTMYPSAVMEKVTGVKIDPAFAGRDPLKEMIEAAHKKNIKVVAWFEFGFSTSYNLNGGVIIKNRPHWASAGVDGKLVNKNGFEWMNGFLPEVQDHLMALIMEVVKNYKVDGIQGDDRLPAMPSEAGYDAYTVAKYKKEHNGVEPPKDTKDSSWVQWRADIMTDFMKRIHHEVKAYNKKVLVTMAPSIFPWGRDEYLQDWPTWVKKGYVDMIIPQLYRYNIEVYKKALDQVTDEQLTKKELKICYPGVLVNVGSYNAEKDFLKNMISENRKKGIKGEVYFFYEGLKKYPELIRELYKNKK